MYKNKLTLNVFEKNIKILKKKFINEVIIYTKIKALKLIINNKNIIKYNPHSQNIDILFFYKSEVIGVVSSYLNNLLFSLNRLWHIKMKFMGKGFKIKRRKRTKSIKFYFYYSHLNVIILKKAKIKQRKKNKFIIKTWNNRNLIKTATKIRNIKPLNIYTKRGIRSSKQIIFKKTGKKSNY